MSSGGGARKAAEACPSGRVKYEKTGKGASSDKQILRTESAPANNANLVSLHPANNTNIFKDTGEGMEETDEHNRCKTQIKTAESVAECCVTVSWMLYLWELDQRNCL